MPKTRTLPKNGFQRVHFWSFHKQSEQPFFVAPYKWRYTAYILIFIYLNFIGRQTTFLKVNQQTAAHKFNELVFSKLNNETTKMAACDVFLVLF